MNEHLKMLVKESGQGLPLLLVPGGLTGWLSWEPFVEYFHSQGRKVIRVQLLNVQYAIENKPMPGDYSVVQESRALGNTLESLNITTPLDIVGWSYGALTSLHFSLDNPSKVRSLTLIEPPGLWILKARGIVDAATQNSIRFFESLHGDITEDMLAAFLQEAGFVGPGEDARELPQWNYWLPFRQALRNSPYLVSQQDEISRLQNLRVPVLLVKGTGSSTWLHRIIDVLGDSIPDSRTIELPSGHGPHIVSRERFLSELRNFQQSVRR